MTSLSRLVIMQYFFALACLLILGVTVDAQRTIKKKPPSRPRLSFSTMEIGAKIDQLPPYYIGHSLPDVYSNLYKRKDRLQKSQYETTDSFEERLAIEHKKPIIGSLTLDNLFGFTFSNFDSKYDADDQTLTIEFESHYPSDDHPSLSITDFRSLLWSTSESKTGSYVGSNAFGVKRRVAVYKGTEFHLVMPKRALGDSILDGLKLQCFGVPTQEARQTESRARVLIVGGITRPYIGKGQSSYTPTIDEPTHTETDKFYLYFDPHLIYVFDLATGKILSWENR